MNGMTRRWAGVSGPAAVALALACVASAPLAAEVGPSSSLIERQQIERLSGLSAGIDAYVALHRGLDTQQPWPHDSVSSAAIAAHREGLASGIRAARAAAVRGDLFDPASVDTIRRRFAESYAGRAAEQFRARIAEEGPLDVSLQLNVAVPPGAGVAPVPPGMLAWLPALPDELEYRFVGRHLVLRDTEADLIIDYVPNLVP